MRFALLGYGHIGRVHQQALATSDKGELVAVVDDIIPDLDIPTFSSIQELQASGIAIDMLIVATPNGLHFEHAQAALNAGWNVLVEKPITLNSKDFERLIFLSEQKQLRVFNMLQLRFSPIVQWIKNLLNQQKLGEIFMVNVNCYWNRNHAYYDKRVWHGTKAMDGGVLFTQFSHFVDVLHYWFHELKPLDIRNYNFNHQGITEFPDSGLLNFQMRDGGVGHMTYTTSTFNKNFDSTITIIGEKGTLQIGGQYMNQINYLHAENIENIFDEEIGKSFHQSAIEEVISAVHEKRQCILDAENARQVIQFLEVVS